MKQTIKLPITEAKFLMSELQKEQYIPDTGDIEDMILMEIFAEQFQKVQKAVLEKKKAVTLNLKPSQLYSLSVYLFSSKFNPLAKLQFVRPIVAVLHKAQEKHHAQFTNSLQNAIE